MSYYLFFSMNDMSDDVGLAFICDNLTWIMPQTT